MKNTYEYMGNTIDHTINHLLALKERHAEKDHTLTKSVLYLLKSDITLLITEFKACETEFLALYANNKVRADAEEYLG